MRSAESFLHKRMFEVDLSVQELLSLNDGVLEIFIRDSGLVSLEYTFKDYPGYLNRDFKSL